MHAVPMGEAAKAMHGPGMQWRWEMKLPLLNLATSAKGSKAEVSPWVSVEAAAGEAIVRCEVQAEANEVPLAEAYREVTEAAASVLVPYGVPVQLTPPVVANASELTSAGIPVPGYVDLPCGAGVRQSAPLDAFVTVWRRLMALPDGAAERIAARALRWADQAAADSRPVEGFVFSWVAFNALYRRQTPNVRSETGAFQRWLKMQPASEAFASLCRSHWPQVEGWLSRLAERDWSLHGSASPGKALAIALARTRLEGASRAQRKPLKALGLAAFRAIYGLRNVVVHGDALPGLGAWVRATSGPAVELSVDLGTGAPVPAPTGQDPEREALSGLAAGAGHIVRAVVRYALQRLLGVS